MTRSQRMEPVQRIADERANAAAKAYAEARQRLEGQEQRLTQLTAFREDYVRQRAESGNGGMDGFRLRDYNAFIARIDTAINHQHEVISQAQADAERARLAWLDVLGRARAIDKVVDRFQTEERREAERKSQRQSDDLAQLRRPTPDPAG